MAKAKLGVAVLLAVVLGVRVGGCDLPDFADVLPIPSPTIEGELFLIVVHESEQPVDGLANLKRNLPWMDGLKDRDVRFVAYDDDLPEAEDYAAELGGQGVLVVDKGGRVVARSEMPEKITSVWLDELLAGVGR